MTTKYDTEKTNKLAELYQAGTSVDDLAAQFDVPVRSVIAKLSSLGIYKKKQYLNKQGQVPVKKEELIERIADLLDTNVELLESLEKANKNVLVMIEKALSVLAE
ncbi:hypothetical protein UFOVP273_118 [uncultured Caudovirales phage]|uniref:Uncharacterized protein n=1 Tax=uncultured Caudovirales phage TaxID=2100421 RepID=A0A6J5LS06_9CAUD|nr:hypothetical protein UFOVP273_118 [uncultured Caudovirales phage]